MNREEERKSAGLPTTQPSLRTESGQPDEQARNRPRRPRLTDGLIPASIGPGSNPDMALAKAFEDLLIQHWHKHSSHARYGIELGEEGCECRRDGFRLYRLMLSLTTQRSLAEPQGLGAVVSNPLTGETWVRGFHTQAVPHAGRRPVVRLAQDWMDPAGVWCSWDQVPQPLVLRSPGWGPPETDGRSEDAGGSTSGASSVTPESATSNTSQASETTSSERGQETGPRPIGSVVRDGDGCQWIRLSHGSAAWWLLDEFGDTGVSRGPLDWQDIPAPIADDDWWFGRAPSETDEAP